MLAAKKGEVRKAGSELLGQLAGEYKIVRKVGSGGFGTVYEAEHPLLKRRAAVKVLHAHPSVDSLAVQRFIEEARSASQIRHRHIVDIFSFGTLPNGQYFYVMDLLDGSPLDRYLRDQGRLAPEVALPLLRTVASAIDALHAASIVHRDLKPGNIFLSWDASGEVVAKLLDFGLVKLLSNPTVHTAEGVPMGTPYYMSPEQCRGEAVDARADVYSFGVICFELLTGKVPFSGDSTTALLMAHVLQPPPRMSELVPELSVDLDEPIQRMLAKDPKDRPSSCGVAVRELEQAARVLGMSIADRLPWLPRPAREQPELAQDDTYPDESGMRDGQADPASVANEGRRWAKTVALVALALALGGAGFALLQGDSAPPLTAVPDPAAASNAVPSPSGTAPAAPPAAALERTTAAPGPSSPQPSAPVANPTTVLERTTAAAAQPSSAEPSVPTTAPPSALEPNLRGAAPQPPAAEAVGMAADKDAPARPAAGSARTVPLTLRGAPPGASVMLGDRQLGPANAPLNLPYGEEPLKLTIAIPGAPSRSLTVLPNAPLELPLPAERARPKRSALPRDLENPF